MNASLPVWFDTHTHLEHDYPFSVDTYLQNAKAAGVRYFVTIGTRPGSLKQLKDFSERYKEVYFTVGIHPHEAKDYSLAIAAEMSALRTHPKCVGVGEIGLDYHYNHSPREVQVQALKDQLELALQWSKPVVIHAREAETDLLTELTWYAKRCKLTQGPGIIHCFSGTADFGKKCLDLGFYLSFSGICTFKTAQSIRDIIETTPLDRILIETDSPFLAPIPFRGKPNQSAYLVHTAETVAKLKQIDLHDFSQAILRNSFKVFDIQP